MADHVHMLISIPPKHSVSHITGKSSIWVAQNIANKQRNFAGHKFWAMGYFVTTVGVNEEIICKYAQNQESDDKRFEELNLFNR